jgi:hypothetical protein
LRLPFLSFFFLNILSFVIAVAQACAFFFFFFLMRVIASPSSSVRASNEEPREKILSIEVDALQTARALDADNSAVGGKYKKRAARKRKNKKIHAKSAG